MDNETGSADGSPPVDGANNATASNNDAKARRSAPLTQERIDLLNAIGFTWTIRSRDSMGESWNQRLLELRQFKQQYGHCLVPSRYEANPELGIWVRDLPFRGCLPSCFAWHLRLCFSLCFSGWNAANPISSVHEIQGDRRPGIH